ncbi:MAG: hypothetical protein DHS20C13_19670 [Thermodesulfobacteriota bacterium]|nr:MAG: hypothetical protein DHS20C13_19670 [Thermodesulfobacteriota bacterium]
MRVCLWVFVLIIVIGSGLSSFGGELIAQRSPIVVNPIDGNSTFSEEDSSVCLDYETRTSSNTCEPDLQVETKTETQTETNSSSSDDTVYNDNDEQISLLPNPEVEFVDEYMIKFDSFKSKDTIFYGGVVPFVALPDGELANQDSFFNEESVSVFLYLKRKF